MPTDDKKLNENAATEATPEIAPLGTSGASDVLVLPEHSSLSEFEPWQEDFEALEIIVVPNALHVRMDVNLNSASGMGGAHMWRVITFANADATPSVKNANVGITTGTTTITDFDDGKVGQLVTIKATGNILISNGGSIRMQGGVSYSMVNGNTLTVVKYTSGEWVEIARNQGFTQAVTHYGGGVNADGTAGTPMPTGWTTSKTGTGTYQVVHNLGHTNYVVVAMSTDQFFIATRTARNNNNFSYTTFNAVGVVAADTATNFVLVLQS